MKNERFRSNIQDNEGANTVFTGWESRKLSGLKK